MTEVTTAPEATAADTVLTFELPGLLGARTFDCTTVPANIRLDFLKTAVRNYIANRVNQATFRHGKEAAVVAWARYDEASKADALQTVVARPEGERPAGPDLEAGLTAALLALTTGNVRKQGTGEKKPRETKDPLISTVTQTVIREVFDGKRVADPKYTFIMARRDVGGDGVAYLNTMIENKVAAAPEGEQATLRSVLEKMRDEKYIKPARIMLGLDVAKGNKDLPSIL